MTPGDLVLDADPHRIEQALGNLVENALTTAPGPWSSPHARRQQVELHVTDEGEGFPAEFAVRAFDRFSRGDEGRGRGGSGLGLAIVQAIAEAHGGTAGVANRERGTDVWISL